MASTQNTSSSKGKYLQYVKVLSNRPQRNTENKTVLCGYTCLEDDIFGEVESLLCMSYSKKPCLLQDLMFKIKPWDVTEDDYCRIKSAFLPVASYEQFISKAADGLRSDAGFDRCITHCVLNHK